MGWIRLPHGGALTVDERPCKAGEGDKNSPHEL